MGGTSRSGRGSPCGGRTTRRPGCRSRGRTPRPCRPWRPSSRPPRPGRPSRPARAARRAGPRRPARRTSVSWCRPGREHGRVAVVAVRVELPGAVFSSHGSSGVPVPLMPSPCHGMGRRHERAEHLHGRAVHPVDAPAAQVYEAVVDFHRWTAWSPWEDLDPAMSRAYSGPDAGPGAVYEWSGNRKAGAGRMEIDRGGAGVTGRGRPAVPQAVQVPRARRSSPSSPTAQSTTVTWTMTGPRTLGPR